MKKIKILSIALIGVISLGMFTGCGKTDTGNGEESNQTNSNKVEVVKEEAFATVPEDALIPDFVKTRYSKYEELEKDYDIFANLINNLVRGTNDEIEGLEEFKSKYGFSGTTADTEVFQKENPEFFEGAISNQIALACNSQEIKTMKKDMFSTIHSYLGNSLMGEKNELNLSKEFAAMKPIEYMEDYLKKNKIEITSVTYPQNMRMFHNGMGTNVFTTEVTIEGTQDGKNFSKTRLYDFHFSSKEDIRSGKEYRKENAIELMAVTESVEKDFNKLNEKF